MKNSTYRWAIQVVLCFLFISCSHKEGNETLSNSLLQAESVMYTRPDSALAILEAMPVPTASNRLEHATWCLLLTQAKYKNYVEQTSDSLINMASEYFSTHDNPQRKAMALYYKGALHEEWNHTEQALQCYLEAADYVKQTSDYQLGYLIHVGIGDIYVYRDITDQAMDAFQEAYRYAKLAENNIYISEALIYIARAHAINLNWDQTIEAYKKAVEVAKTTDNLRILSSAFNGLSLAYGRKKEYASALKYGLESLTIKERGNLAQEQSQLSLGGIYSTLEKMDSAFYYFNKASLSDNIYTTSEAYRQLAQLSQEKRDYVKAYEYLKEYAQCQDSIHKLDKSEALMEIQAKYNHEKLLNEKNRIEIEKDIETRKSLYLGILFIVTIGTLAVIYQRRLIQKERRIKENEKLIQKYTLRIHENESLMSRNESRIKELANELEQNKEIHERFEEQENALNELVQANVVLQQENDQFQRKLSARPSISQEYIDQLDKMKVLSHENLRLSDREKFLCSQVIDKTEILSALKNSPKYLDPNQWEIVTQEINLVYENYAERLKGQFPELSKNELFFCCLIKLRLSVPSMATILSITPAAVTKRKQRLKECFTQRLGESFKQNQTLDIWLWEY